MNTPGDLAAWMAQKRQAIDAQRQHLAVLCAQDADLRATLHAAEGRALDALGGRLAVASARLAALLP